MMYCNTCGCEVKWDRVKNHEQKGHNVVVIPSFPPNYNECYEQYIF